MTTETQEVNLEQVTVFRIFVENFTKGEVSKADAQVIYDRFLTSRKPLHIVMRSMAMEVLDI